MIKRILTQEIKNTVKKLWGKEVDFEVSWNGRFADYSSNLAMKLKKDDSQKTAERIKESLTFSKKISRYISKIETAGPGFLNFWLSAEGIQKAWKEVLKRDGFNFGKRQKIQVEFISANPTGPLHIGNGRSAFYGDALSNILEYAGYKVEREYFINDAKESNQIKELGKTALGAGKSYLNDYLFYQIGRLKPRIKSIVQKTKEKDKLYKEIGFLIAKAIQEDNKIFITRDLDIKFDKWFSEERDLYQKNLIKKTLALLKKKNLVYEKGGALWFKTSKYGDDEDRVVVRSDGVPSYFLTDIAYHFNKAKRGYKKVINVWGADHQGHLKRMMAAKKMLGWSYDLDILITQLVVLKSKGGVEKLSKRKGNVVFLKDLLKEVNLDVLRWFFLEKSLSTHMEFDVKLAKEQSEKNPVYYVQYAGARMSSILKKAKTKVDLGSFSGLKAKNQLNSLSKPERFLILKLIQFPEIIEEISKDYQVQRLTAYLYGLAKIFTEFYEKTRVLDADSEDLRRFRLFLVFSARKILERSFSLLGISAPKKM